jgi:molybdopterin synthase catalytic subunit
VRVSVLAFARLGDLLGRRSVFELPAGANLDDLWSALIARQPALYELRPSTRVARNGRIEDTAAMLRDGDELALLPPVGGG